MLIKNFKEYWWRKGAEKDSGRKAWIEKKRVKSRKRKIFLKDKKKEKEKTMKKVKRRES